MKRESEENEQEVTTNNGNAQSQDIPYPPNKQRKLDSPSQHPDSSSASLQSVEDTTNNRTVGNIQQVLSEQSQINDLTRTPPQATSPVTASSATNVNNNNESSSQEKMNKQQHAMQFLVKVRMHYNDSPQVYNQFLEIMKDFKAASIDTPEVIAKVKDLFRGNNNLISEFNAFLPPGFKIEPDPEPTPTPAVAATGSNPPQADLEHARNYVRKIKNRFATQPQIYKQFLEILHAYYQGQHLIQEVLDEVGELFQHQQDLLDEFKQFLPKAVSDTQLVPPSATGAPGAVKKPKKKAKEEPRKPEKRREVEYERPRRNVPERRVEEEYTPGPPPTRSRTRLEEQQQQQIQPKEPTHQRTTRAAEPVFERRPILRRIPPPPVNVPELGGFTEFNFFKAVKHKLNDSILYREFLICINLFSLDVLSKKELVVLVRDLLGKYPDLYTTFKQFIGYKDAEPEELPVIQEETVSEPQAEQTKQEQDGVTAAGTEDSSEDEMIQLFEEERFEIGLFIELNNSTLRALEHILEKAENTTTPISLESLDLLHVRNIERIYGERAGEIIEILYHNPGAAISVVQKRLRQKTQEWLAVKKDIEKSLAQFRQPKEQSTTENTTENNNGTSNDMDISSTTSTTAAAISPVSVQ